MSFNLLDVAKSQFNGDFISKAASFLGESEGGVSKAIGSILPTALSGLADKASTSHGAQEVANLASEAHNSGILNNLGGFFSGGSMLSKGTDLVKGLFGSKLGGVVDTISSVAGLKSGSSSSLFGMALPVILGCLGKHSSDNNLGASGISSLLGSGKSMWSSLLPSGLSNILGGVGATAAAATGAVTGGVKNVANTVTNYADDTVDAAKGGMKWLLPLLLLLALGALAWYLLQGSGCKSDTTGTATGGDTTTHAAVTTNTVDTSHKTAVATVVESLKVKLSNGTEINANKGGIESQLVTFLNDASAKVDTTKGANWYNFDNLNFDNGKATITKESMIQVQNLAAILKSYPAFKMKIGGYTDASGDAAKNLALSQSRADAVKAAVIAAGGSAAQITEAKGYGSTMAKYPATASDEQRREDRKTAVKVVSK